MDPDGGRRRRCRAAPSCDSAGSPYEAHVKKADGTYVTVKLDSSFSVTGIENGFGAGPSRQAAPNGSTPSTTTG